MKKLSDAAIAMIETQNEIYAAMLELPDGILNGTGVAMYTALLKMNEKLLYTDAKNAANQGS